MNAQSHIFTAITTVLLLIYVSKIIKSDGLCNFRKYYTKLKDLQYREKAQAKELFTFQKCIKELEISGYVCVIFGTNLELKYFLLYEYCLF